MHKHIPVTGVILALATAVLSCARLDGPGNGNSVLAGQNDGSIVTIAVSTNPAAAAGVPKNYSSNGSAATTRTSLGQSEVNGVYPVWWSDGDRISVNGIESSPLSIAPSQKTSTASFQVRNVSAPYYVVYPSSSVKDTDAGSGICTLDIPDTQMYIPDSFGNGSAILFGVSESESEPVALQNLCGAIRIVLKDEGAVIRSFSLTSLGDEPISGSFSLNLRTGELTPKDATQPATKTIRVTLPEEGVRLTSEGVSFTVTVPQGNYPQGFLLRFDDEAKHIQRSYWLRTAEDAAPGVSLAQGEMVVLGPVAYAPDAREITSASDWEEFASACNAGDWEDEWLSREGKVIVSEDISATSLSRVKEFAYVLDAQGHTITQTAARGPLFGKLSGKVENLFTEGAMTASDPSVAGACVFATELCDGGIIENCVNRVSVSYTGSSKTVAGSFVRTLSGGSLIGCTNEGQIKINVDINSADQPVVVGGLVGTASSSLPQALSCPSRISSCINRGSVSVVLTKAASSAHRPVQAGYGGIIGTVTRGDADNCLTISSSVNDAAVSVNYSVSPTSATALFSGVGGIVGAATKYSVNGSVMYWWTVNKPASVATEDAVVMRLEDCINNGDISNALVSSSSSDDPTKCFAGGIAGALNGTAANHISVKGCRNYGKVIPHEGKYTRSALCSAAGGLAGLSAYADFENCVVKSGQIGSLKRQSYATAGAIAYLVASSTLTGCSIWADLVHVRCTDYSDMNYAIGFNLSTKQASKGGLWKQFVKIDGSSVTGCRFGGTVSYNSELIAYNGSSFKLDMKDSITPSTFEGLIASDSFKVDAEGMGFPSMVSFSGNTYWDGKE